MPVPKKKRVVLSPVKPGIIKQFLDTNYSDIPSTPDILQNGHVIYTYLEYEKSVSKCVSKLTEKIGKDVKLNDVNKIEKQFVKFKKPTDPVEFRRFKSFCNEVFLLSTTTNPRTSTSVVADFASVMVSSHTTVTHPPNREGNMPNVRSNLEDKCTNCNKMKQRLTFTVQSQVKMRRRHIQTIKTLKQTLKMKRNKLSVKRFSQVIKRKDIQLAKTKQMLSSDSVQSELIMARHKLSQFKKNVKRRKLYHAKQGSSASPSPYDSDIQISELKEVIKSKNEVIKELENNKLMLEERDTESPFIKDGKRFNETTRLFVYDAIVNQVPTQNIPTLLEKFALRSGLQMDKSCIPHRNTVEMMARELGAVSDLQVSETLMTDTNITIGFDATTQEGVHINSLHITTCNTCQVVAIDELAGGTAEDYKSHVCDSIDRLAGVFSDFHQKDYQDSRSKIINNISNTLTDRVAVNHASIKLICDVWGKPLNELNCHLHPLDTIATATKSALKKHETDHGKLFGKDCLAGNVVLQINKFRFKDGKGDPKGFVNFLRDEGLPIGILPRYRGNRLHILFHICGKLIEHYNLFQKFFKTGTVSCGGLQSSIRDDFNNPQAKIQMQILGLIGKLLTGPWMKKFYTSLDTQVNHVEGISIVKNVITSTKQYAENPLTVLATETDFFGNKLHKSDNQASIPAKPDLTLKSLQIAPENQDSFCTMMSSTLMAVVTVLERQYERYFGWDITEKLTHETASARCHNIDAEEIMGMFSAAQKRAPNATLCYLSSKMRAQKNKVTDYLDLLDETKREKVIRMAVTVGRKQRQHNRKKVCEMKSEMSRRQAMKREKKAASERKNVEKKIRQSDLDIKRDFPDLESCVQDDLEHILNGKVVGRDILHVWYDRDTQQKTTFCGRIEKRKKKAGGTYVIGYWGEDDTHDDAVDYELSGFELAADFVCGDLVLS